MKDQYAVIGNPIGHSKSPTIHTMFAQATRQELEYTAILGPLGGFDACAREFRERGGRGLNVTTPFKLDAYRFASKRSERAELAGAANAMKFDGREVLAENFDGVGLVRDVVHNLGFSLRGKRVLMLGAGGAARGALLPFLDQGPATLVIANRTLAKAQALAQIGSARGPVSASSYAGLGGQSFDLVFNATSASLTGELPAVPPHVFGTGSLAYELAYGKKLTPFLRLARDAGVSHIADGVGMLAEQAAEAFYWWRGIRPDTSGVIKVLTIPLE